MTREIVYVVAFDGCADYQTALALTEIRRGGDHLLLTVAASRQPLRTASGLRLLPDLDLADVDPAHAAMLVVPGGIPWERGEGAAAVATVHRLGTAGVPVAAIGGGVLALARAGLLDTRRHTANHPGYLETWVPDYHGARHFDAAAPAITDGGVTTAAATAAVELAREVIRTLDLYDEDDTGHWYRLYRHGIAPPWLAAPHAPVREVAA